MRTANSLASMSHISCDDVCEGEYIATEIRDILLDIFPHRKLVLSQFTFFVRSGVAEPSGEVYRRGRRCFRLPDLLSIACVLALKERGIPLKVLGDLPSEIRANAGYIMATHAPCWIAGFGDDVELVLCDSVSGGVSHRGSLVDRFLDDDNAGKTLLMWRFDVTSLAIALKKAAAAYRLRTIDQGDEASVSDDSSHNIGDMAVAA